MTRLIAFLQRIRALGFWGVALGLIVWLGNYYTIATISPGLTSFVTDIIRWAYLPYLLFIVGFALLVGPWVLGKLAARGWIITTPFDFDVEVEGAIVFLRVTNYVVDTEFAATVERVTGVENPTDPGESWPIPWRNMYGARFLKRGDPRKLVLAEGDGYGHAPNRPGTFLFRAGFGPGERRPCFIRSQPADEVYKHEAQVVVTVTGTGIDHRVTHSVRLGFTRHQDPTTLNLRVRARIKD